MKLDQKYFVPFILVCAAFTMLFIVISSFNFTEQRLERFKDYTLKYEELLTKKHPYVLKEDSLSLGELSGKPTLVFFWASWSELSSDMMAELFAVQANNSNVNIVAALVKDATESLDESTLNYDFEYIDGTILFNELRAPGIPSYILLDKQGTLISAHVGYKNGEVKELLIPFSQ